MHKAFHIPRFLQFFSVCNRALGRAGEGDLLCCIASSINFCYQFFRLEGLAAAVQTQKPPQSPRKNEYKPKAARQYWLLIFRETRQRPWTSPARNLLPWNTLVYPLRPTLGLKGLRNNWLIWLPVEWPLVHFKPNWYHRYLNQLPSPLSAHLYVYVYMYIYKVCTILSFVSV